MAAGSGSASVPTQGGSLRLPGGVRNLLSHSRWPEAMSPPPGPPRWGLKPGLLPLGFLSWRGWLIVACNLFCLRPNEEVFKKKALKYTFSAAPWVT